MLYQAIELVKELSKALKFDDRFALVMIGQSNFKYKPQKRGFVQASFLYKLGLVILQSLQFLS
jgi:hypothetical protein